MLRQSARDGNQAGGEHIGLANLNQSSKDNAG
jgi:hypothetical protein